MILIVDDKYENVLSLKSVLEANAFEVDTALSGEDALKKILKNTYALIILDVQMPGMDGFEVAEAISGVNISKDTPILFLSAVNTHKTFVTKGFEAGGVDYLTKPVDPDILLLKVRTFCRLFEQTRALNQAHQFLQQEIEIRKRAEQTLSATVSELHSTLESIPLIAFTARPDGTIEFVNQYWYRYSTHRERFPQPHPEDDHLPGKWQECLYSGQPLELEIRLKELSSESYYYHLLKTRPVIANNQIIKWVGTFTDIDEQKRLNEILEQKVRERTHELQEINKELEASNHDLQQFASVASHDLQEPLRKIRMFSSLIIGRQYEDAYLTEYINKITDSSARMSTLIHDLLSFARLSDMAVFELTSLEQLIREIMSDLELTIAEKNAVLTIGSLPSLKVMPGLLRQALQNIVSNALKFTRTEVTPQISIRADYIAEPTADSQPVNEGPYCRICIQDNGIGFDEQYADQIFTLFQRLNNQDQYEGTGIGLAIARKIIDKHNGSIIARSQPEAGSTFIIILPVNQPASHVVEPSVGQEN